MIEDAARGLTLARFTALAEAYGGAIERWPEAWRAPALAIARDDEPAAILARAAALDSVLDLYVAPASRASLAGRIILSAERASTLRRRIWRWCAGAGLVGVGLAGVLIGSVLTTTLLSPASTAGPVSIGGAATAFGFVGDEADIAQDPR